MRCSPPTETVESTFSALCEQKLQQVYQQAFLSGVITQQVEKYAALVLQANEQRELVVLADYEQAVAEVLDFRPAHCLSCRHCVARRAGQCVLRPCVDGWLGLDVEPGWQSPFCTRGKLGRGESDEVFAWRATLSYNRGTILRPRMACCSLSQ